MSRFNGPTDRPTEGGREQHYFRYTQYTMNSKSLDFIAWWLASAIGRLLYWRSHNACRIEFVLADNVVQSTMFCGVRPHLDTDNDCIGQRLLQLLLLLMLLPPFLAALGLDLGRCCCRMLEQRRWRQQLLCYFSIGYCFILNRSCSDFKMLNSQINL